MAAGRIACLVALIAVLVFMVASYGLFGLFADVALAINVVLIIGALSMLGAALTLPGIAGIVLTVGMAVDANVLVFERIREESRGGRRPLQAIETGYERALSAIIDANVTTFIAAAILFGMGSGPGEGLCRDAGHRHHHLRVHRLHGDPVSGVPLVRRTAPESAGGMTMRAARTSDEGSGRLRLKLIPAGTTFDFMRNRRACCAASAVLVAVSAALYLLVGLNFGIDFRGGTMVEARFENDADLGSIRSLLSDLDLGDVAVQEFGLPTDVLIRVETQPGGGDAQVAADRAGTGGAAGRKPGRRDPAGRGRGAEGVGRAGDPRPDRHRPRRGGGAVLHLGSGSSGSSRSARSRRSCTT